MKSQSTNPTAAMPTGQQTFIYIIGLMLLALIAYFPVFQNDYITLDDNLYIYQNPMVLQAQDGLSLDAITWAFTSINVGNWHPLTMISHAIDVWLFGVESPGAHHAVSLFLHTINAILLFWFFLKTTGRAGPAFMVAALFAVHPIHVESVAWASSRKDVLSFFFVMLTLLAYTRWVRLDRKWSAYIPVMLAFACALMSKPTAVTLPALLLLIDFWPLNRASNQATSEAPSPVTFSQAFSSYLKQLPRLGLEKLPLLVLAVAMSVITFLVQKSASAVTTTAQLPLDARILNIPVSYARYLKKLLWPDDLAVLYPHPIYWPLLTVLFSILLLALVTFAVFYLAKKHNKNYLPVGWLWFLGVLVPMIGLVQVGSQSMADRYAYISFIGLYIILVWSAADFLKRSQKVNKLAFGVCTVVLIPLIITAHAQAARWANPTSLYEHGVSITQNNFFLLNNLGEVYLTQNRLPEARAALEKALAINPNLIQGHENLGLVCFMLQDPTLAATHFQKAVDLGSKRPNTLLNLGWALAESGQFAQALLRFQQLEQTTGETPESLTGQAASLASLERFAEAQILFNKLQTKWPTYTPAWFHQARMQIKTNQLAAAEAQLKKLIQAEPTNLPAILLLAEALTKNKKTQEAQFLLDEAKRRFPNDQRIDKARFATDHKPQM